MYFGHKHVETGANRSHELVTFLKYHMPLIHPAIYLVKRRKIVDAHVNLQLSVKSFSYVM